MFPHVQNVTLKEMCVFNFSFLQQPLVYFGCLLFWAVFEQMQCALCISEHLWSAASAFMVWWQWVRCACVSWKGVWCWFFVGSTQRVYCRFNAGLRQHQDLISPAVQVAATATLPLQARVSNLLGHWGIAVPQGSPQLQHCAKPVSFN